MISFVISGAVLGAAAGMQPGPFQAYLLTQTLKQGWKATLPAACAPLLSDGPIIALMLLILTRTPHSMLTLLRFAGGLYLIYLAWQAYAARHVEVSGSSQAARQSVLQAAGMNLLNPNPYIFWATVAGPLLLEGWRISPVSGAGFLAGFYGAIISVFMAFVLFFGLVGTFTKRSRAHIAVFSACVLLGFGIYLISQGFIHA